MNHIVTEYSKISDNSRQKPDGRTGLAIIIIMIIMIIISLLLLLLLVDYQR